MIDVTTLLVLLATADVILGAVLAMGTGGRSRDGVLAWTASLAARAAALGLVAGGPGGHLGWAAGAAGLLSLSMTLQATALLSVGGRGLPAWSYPAVVAGVALPMQLLAADPGGALVFGGLVFGTFATLLAAISSQLPDATSGRARRTLVVTFAFGAAALYARGLASAFLVDPLQPFTHPTGMQSLSMLAMYAAAIVGTFGFMALHKDRADAEAERLATMDPLTGTYNRRVFREIAERELARARRAGQPLSIILADIDHFRLVNERHGEQVGDAVLASCADVLRTALRKEDMLVRYGGTQFLVLLPEVPGPGAVVVAGRIRRTFAEEPMFVNGQSFAMTASIGVAARLDEGPESVDTLIARAESALALAKERGRDRVVALSLGRSIAA